MPGKASKVDGVLPASLERLRHRFGARAGFQLAEHGLEVEFDGMQGDAQAAGDRLVRQAVGDGVEDLRLTRGQKGPRLGLLYGAEAGRKSA